jgi:hypothetical protein
MENKEHMGSEGWCEVRDKDLERIEQCEVVEGFLELYRAYREHIEGV